MSKIANIVKSLPLVSALRGDLEDLQSLLFRRRPPRVAVLTAGELDAGELLALLIAHDDQAGIPQIDVGEWVSIDGRQGKLDWFWLDAGTPGVGSEWRAGESNREADVVLAVLRLERMDDELDTLVSSLRACALASPLPRVIPVAADVGSISADVVKRVRSAFGEAFRKATIDADPARVIGATDVRSQQGLAEAILALLPDGARIEGARVLYRAIEGRRRLGDDLIEACSDIAATVALTPIPFSDMAVLGPVQAALVSTLAYISGRSWSRKTVGEWLASLGVVGGAGFGLRWSAQQLVKIVPGAGSLVSASVAGAGTSALGKSAMRYFLREDAA